MKWPVVTFHKSEFVKWWKQKPGEVLILEDTQKTSIANAFDDTFLLYNWKKRVK